MILDTRTLLSRYQPKEGKPLSLGRQVCCLRFSPCGKILAAGDFEGTVLRWDATSDKLPPLPALTGHGGWVQRVAFHPGGNRLFSADSWGRLSCWPFAEREPRPTWTQPTAHEGWVRGLAVSPDGKVVASCGRDGVLRLWSAEKGEKVRECAEPGADLYCVAFHPDGKSLFYGDSRGVIRQRDLEGKPLREFDARALYLYDRIQDVGGVRCLAFDTPGETLLAGGCKPTSGAFVQGAPLLLYFDLASGKLKQSLTLGTDNDGFVHDVHWHPAGFVMAVTSGQPGQGQLLFHRPGDAAAYFTSRKMPNCHALAVHPGGRKFVVAATNAGSSGNGRPTTKDKVYPGNSSPLYPWDLAMHVSGTASLGPDLAAEVERQLLGDLARYAISQPGLRIDWTDPGLNNEGHCTNYLDGRLESLCGLNVVSASGEPVARGWMDFVHGGDGSPLFVFWLFLSLRSGGEWEEVKSKPTLPRHIWDALPELSKLACTTTGAYDARWSRDPLVQEWREANRVRV